MKTNSKILIDKYVGFPIAIIFNLIARIIGFLFRINHSFKSSPKRIAVSKYQGMGSVIQSTPLLQSLKKSFPETEIIYITSIANKELLSYFPFVDKVYIINDKNIFDLIISTIKVTFKLWKYKIDTFLDLETYSYFSTILTTVSLARNRVSFYRKDGDIRLGIFTHLMYFNIKSSISMVYLQMGKITGCKVVENKLFRFDINDEDKIQLANKIQIQSEIKPYYIVINPNASDLRPERKWNKNNFKILIESLIKKYNNSLIFLIGSGNEKKYVDSLYTDIDQECRKNIINTASKLSLLELITLIEIADIVITNDTGPMHIAFAQNKKTIALFGPCTPEQYGFSGENTHAIYKNLYCSPCVHDFLKSPCNGNNKCMEAIIVDDVIDIADKTIINTKLQDSISEKIIYSFNERPLGIIERKR